MFQHGVPPGRTLSFFSSAGASSSMRTLERATFDDASFEVAPIIVAGAKPAAEVGAAEVRRCSRGPLGASIHRARSPKRKLLIRGACWHAPAAWLAHKTTTSIASLYSIARGRLTEDEERSGGCKPRNVVRLAFSSRSPVSRLCRALCGWAVLAPLRRVKYVMNLDLSERATVRGYARVHFVFV